ncbi:hypothetical protein BJ138DRAFT_1211851 [Hygrophoropsis aurantiaca]|uniref:Uncharacterized protein n=1 Tax=Hygrophoropsis aurantiaca TaxID=72124 RepID=A0ACB8ATV9_9AGAM|nr:hypothetical protein BJ138DRAFT_1211851 [Hygrophoropsis aurantiaca]
MSDPITFKLSKPGGLTRRVAFPGRPGWTELAARIGSLYEIENNNIGVSYIDGDGDEVTLSSDEELQEYLRFLPSHTSLIRFVVQDLNSLRSTESVSSARSNTPQQANFRNTFGGHDSLPLVFEVEDEWQRLPGSLGGLYLSRDSPDSPHAFVEVLESDISVDRESSRHADNESVTGDSAQSDMTFTTPKPDTKGKGKARSFMRATVEDDVSSTGSIIADEAPSKPPVHVYDMTDTEDIPVNPTKSPLSASGAATPAQAESTPVFSEQPLNFEDPPEPIVEPSANSISLTHDVATLLSTLSTVVAAHPELSEGIRNIVSNATNGAYWAAHREAVSHAAQNISRSAMERTGRTMEDIRRSTEEQAGARVADALGKVFRALGETVTTARAFDFPQETQDPVHPPPEPRPTQAPPSHDRVPFANTLPHQLPRDPWHLWSHGPPHRRATTHWGGFPHLPPPPPPPPIPHMPRGPWAHQHPHHPPHFWRPPPVNMAGRPRNEAREASAAAADARAASAPDSHSRATGVQDSGAAYSPSVPSPIVFGTFEDATASTPPDNATTNADAHATSSVPQETNPPVSAAPSTDAPFNTLWGDFTQSNPWKQTPTAEELRAEVERAKADYKARKEMYRKMKAERKKAQEQDPDVSNVTATGQSGNRSAPPDTPAAGNGVAGSSNNRPLPVPEPVVNEPAPATNESTSAPAPTPDPPVMHIVSNARGPYPQLEMFSVPHHHRSNTTGHASRRVSHENRETRSLNRITRKLSDMGFTESTYPNLGAKVMAQLSSHSSVTKEIEDDIVTNLIEDLITMNPQPARAGNSRDRDIPGAWS